jgi:hypothetical protein
MGSKPREMSSRARDDTCASRAGAGALAAAAAGGGADARATAATWVESSLAFVSDDDDDDEASEDEENGICPVCRVRVSTPRTPRAAFALRARESEVVRALRFSC